MRAENLQAEKIRLEKLGTELKENKEEIKRVLNYQSLQYVLPIICTELISWHHDDLLVGHFKIEKTKELIGEK